MVITTSKIFQLDGNFEKLKLQRSLLAIYYSCHRKLIHLRKKHYRWGGDSGKGVGYRTM